VKGSYVLDVALGTTNAKDVDVFYMGDKPSDANLARWLVENGLPPAPIKQLEQFASGGTKIVRKHLFDWRPVDSLAVPDGGGEMTFNVDCWHIPMGGRVHVFDPKTQTSAPPAAGGPGPLVLLNPARDVGTEAGLKGLLKMLLYPSLRDALVATKLVAEARRDLAARPCAGSLGEQAVALLDEMLQGARAADPVAARSAVKLAEDELRGR
jgi:hypothetical protein